MAFVEQASHDMLKSELLKLQNSASNLTVTLLNSDGGLSDTYYIFFSFSQSTSPNTAHVSRPAIATSKPLAVKPGVD